jgi:hypothetical protein
MQLQFVRWKLGGRSLAVVWALTPPAVAERSAV